MRKFYWYLTAYIKKKGLIFVLSLVVGGILFSLLVPLLFSALGQTKAEYIGVIGEYSLDNLPKVVTEQLSGGLTATQPDGSVVPLLATRWAVEQEGTQYRFLLKDNLFWSDGQPVTTDDIQYNFPDVERVVTPQDIVFKLPAPYAAFPNLVSEPLLRRGQLKKLGFWSKPSVIGIGPVVITDYQTLGNKLTELTLSEPEGRKIYRFYLTESEAVTAFKQGQVDSINSILSQQEIMAWPNVQTETKSLSDQYVALFFNHRDQRLQKNIRQAFAYAISKPSDDTRASGPISDQSWAYFSGIKEYERDLDRAVERLFDELPREPLNFTITTTPLYSERAQQIGQELTELGQLAQSKCQEDSKIKEKELCPNLAINITERVVSVPDKSDFELMLIGQKTPADPDQYAMWHSDQPTNFTGYKNTRIDTLLEKGRQLTDQGERKVIYEEFQQYLLEDVAAVFLERLETYRVSRK